MDIVLGVSMEPSAVRMLLIEGANADGATVEEESIEVAASKGAAGADAGDAATDRVIAALVGTREGAAEGGYQLTSTGVTWTDPSEVAALRLELAARDVGGVMLVSPLLAAAALAQTVGAALDYEYIAMLFVESGSATLAVVEVADGSIVDLHRQSVGDESLAAGLVTMVAGLDAPASRADGVFLIGCGVDIVGVKPALEAATSLVVSCPEEPEMALARGAALASANAPLFASSTSALAYALDPGTGEVNPRALTPSYLDVCAMAGVSEGALAYSAVEDDTEHAVEPQTDPRRRPLALVSGAIVGVAAVVAGVLIVSLASNVRPTAAQQPSPRESVPTPALQAPATELPAQVLLPGSSAAPPPSPAPPVAPPPVEVAAAPAPPPVIRQAPPQTVTRPAQAPAYVAPAPRRQPTQQAAPPVQAPVQQAVPPSAPPPAAPAPAAPAPAAPPTPVMTMYLHLPFVSIPIPINPPPPPPPPAEPGP